MKKLILIALCLSAFGQDRYKWNVFTNNLDITGGFSAPAPYMSALQTAASSLSISLSTHGQGTVPAVACYQSSDGEQVLPQVLNAGLIGNLVINFSPAFTGYCRVTGPGANSGGAADVVGPTSATSQSLACFSGTSGKILSMCTGLTTVGAVPYVSASGVLSQDQTAGGQFFWDATSHRLGVGTASPQAPVQIGGTSASPNNTLFVTTNAFTYLSAGSVFRMGHVANGGTTAAIFDNLISGGAAEGGHIAFNGSVAGGNVLIGGKTNGNFKLDVQAEGSSGLARFWSQTPTTGTTLVAVRAGVGQSGNLQEWQNNAGTALASINGGGGGVFATLQSQSAFSLGSSGGGIFFAPSDGVVRLTNFANTDFNRLQFGGTTSSFPSLKRSTTTLQVRLADDSGPAAFNSGGYIGGITSKTAQYDVTQFDYTILGDTTGGSFSVRLPNAPVTGSIFNVKKIAAGNTLTITTVGGTVTIDGSTSVAVTVNNTNTQVQFDGTNYRIL